MLNFFKKDPSKVIRVNEIDELIGAVELIDIREPDEFKGGSIKTAKNIPMGNLLAAPNKYLSKDKTYYIMCQSGSRSGMATRMLRKQGFTVINVVGGIGSYSGKKRM